MSEFFGQVAKALALKIDREITGVNNGTEVLDEKAILLEHGVLVLDCNEDDDTLRGLNFDMFWFDEWDDYEGEEY